MRILILLFTLLFSISCQASLKKAQKENSLSAQNKPYVLMMSLDGFRADYIEKYQPPFLLSLAKKGVRTKGLVPVYPSSTFPNHYSIATGMYVDSHGLVNNNMYDPQTKRHFSLGNRDEVRSGFWYGGEPIWLTAEKQGMLAASYFWVGTDADIQSSHPSYYRVYDGSIANSKRVKQIVEWLKLPEANRPHLLMGYFSDVDSAGHSYGPDSPKVREAVLKVDQELRVLYEEVQKLNLPLTFIVVSDHGMHRIEPRNTIDLSKVLGDVSEEILFKGRGANTYIYGGNKAELLQMKSKINRTKGLKAYLKKEIPNEYRLKSHTRAPDLLVEAEASYYISHRLKHAADLARGGAHGYNPYKYPSMNGIFLADGPRLKEGYLFAPVRNVNIYPFITEVLGLDITHRIDGQLSNIQNIFK